MTEPAAVTADDVRRLVLEARAAVDAIEALPTAAATDDDRAWAQHRAESIGVRWEQLLLVLREARAGSLDAVLGPIVSTAVPLDDASEAMRPAADGAKQLLDVLAEDMEAVLDPLVDEDTEQYTPAGTAQLTDALRVVAPEFGA